MWRTVRTESPSFSFEIDQLLDVIGLQLGQALPAQCRFDVRVEHGCVVGEGSWGHSERHNLCNPSVDERPYGEPIIGWRQATIDVAL